MAQDPPLDFLKQPIRPGDRVVYITGGTSPGITLADVINIEPRTGVSYSQWKIQVTRIRDDCTTFAPGGDGHGYKDANKIITLAYPERIIVVDRSAV